MGYFSGDWTYEDYKREVTKAKNQGKKAVHLSLEGCSYFSEQSLQEWARADGYRNECKYDTVSIYFE
jgi:hypothetical protein